MGRGTGFDFAVFFLAVAGALTLPLMGSIANPTCLSPYARIGTSTYTVKGESMLPTLVPEDDIIACKTDTFDVERGDLVILDKARDGRLIKRVKRIIGLPGDTIRIAAGTVVINDAMVPRRRLDDFLISPIRTVAHYEETLPNGVAYRVLDMKSDGRRDNTQPINVPAGFYYVLGDHRDRSLDSRAPRFGLVPAAAIKAKVTHHAGGDGSPMRPESSSSVGDPHKEVPAAAGSS